MLVSEVLVDLHELAADELQPALLEAGDDPPMRPRCTPSGLTITKVRSSWWLIYSPP